MHWWLIRNLWLANFFYFIYTIMQTSLVQAGWAKIIHTIFGTLRQPLGTGESHPPIFFFSDTHLGTYMYISYHDPFLLFNDRRSVFVRRAFLKEKDDSPAIGSCTFVFLCPCDVYSLYLFQLKQLWKCVCDSVSHFPCIALSLSLLPLMRGNPSSQMCVHM